MMSVNIANALSKQGVESFLCATRVEGALKEKLNSEINYLFLNRKSTLDISAIFRLKKYIQEYQIDIMHAHSSSFFITTMIKILVPKVKLIWHDHYGGSEHLEQRKLQTLKFCSRFFNAIISVNNNLRNWSEEKLNTKNAYYLPNFASLSDSKNKTTLKGNNGKRIVCLAGFRPQKDHINLLKAFKITKQSHSDWTLHLVGNHYEDGYYQTVKLFISENNLKENVFLYHNSTDVKNILSQSSIGVLSSKSEGLPVSLLEYGLAKLPVVATEVGECKEVVKYGFIVPPSDETALAINIEKLIFDVELRNETANKFYNHINENYSEQKIIHKLLKIYTP